MQRNHLRGSTIGTIEHRSRTWRLYQTGFAPPEAFQHATGQLENTAGMKGAKKDLARGLTVARQRNLDVDAELRKQKANS